MRAARAGRDSGVRVRRTERRSAETISADSRAKEVRRGGDVNAGAWWATWESPGEGNARRTALAGAGWARAGHPRRLYGGGGRGNRQRRGAVFHRLSRRDLPRGYGGLGGGRAVVHAREAPSTTLATVRPSPGTHVPPACLPLVSPVSPRATPNGFPQFVQRHLRRCPGRSMVAASSFVNVSRRRVSPANEFRVLVHLGVVTSGGRVELPVERICSAGAGLGLGGGALLLGHPRRLRGGRAGGKGQVGPLFPRPLVAHGRGERRARRGLVGVFGKGGGI